jgi:hypothetical protein
MIGLLSEALLLALVCIAVTFFDSMAFNLPLVGKFSCIYFYLQASDAWRSFKHLLKHFTERLEYLMEYLELSSNMAKRKRELNAYWTQHSEFSFPPGVLTPPGVFLTGAGAAPGQTDLTSAIASASLLLPQGQLPLALDGLSLTPGVYNFPPGVVTLGVGSTLTLNGVGVQNPSWVFQIS